MSEFVILVDENDRETGTAEKMEAHRKGLLHRAFSVFIFNHQNQMLIHQRAIKKYHSGGKWTNACCGHPRPGEDTKMAATRRLAEEMGMQCTLIEKFSFIYKAQLDNALTEHEVDHVFFGISDEIKPNINSSEVMNYKWMDIESLSNEVTSRPENFTEWFKICFAEVMRQLKK